MKSLRIFLILLGVSLTAIAFGESWNVRRVAEYATDCFTNVKVAGDVAYCATRYGLVVMDVSDKANPRVIERFPTEGRPVGVELRDTLLYLCDGSEGLRIFSLVDPVRPVEIGHCPEAGAALRLKLVDTLAYVACSRRGVSVVDISDPRNPEQVGFYGSPIVEDVALMDTLLYTSGGNIQILNVSNPRQPERLVVDDDISAGEITLFNGMLFCAPICYNLDDLMNPVRLYYLRYVGSTYFDINDHYLFNLGGYPGHGDDGFFCYNFSNLESPSVQGSCQLSIIGGSGSDLEYEDGFAYSLLTRFGLSIVDARDVDAPEEVGAFVNGGALMDLTVVEPYAYVLDKLGRLRSFDISNPNQPVQTDMLEFSNFGDNDYGDPRSWSICSDDDWLFIFGPNEEPDEQIPPYRIRSFSLEDPAHPELTGIGHQMLSSMSAHLLCHEGLLFYNGNSGDFGIHIYEVGENGSIDWIRDYDLVAGYRAFTFRDIRIYNDLLLVSGDGRIDIGVPKDSKFMVFDLSNPREPNLLGEINLAGNDVDSFDDFAVQGDLVYVQRLGTTEMSIISIAEPRNPELLTTFDNGHTVTAKVIVDGDLMLLGGGEDGIDVYSLDEPLRLEHVGSYNVPDYLYDMQVVGDVVFTADYSDLGIYEFSVLRGPWYLSAPEASHDFDSVAVDSSVEWELVIDNISQLAREISSIELESEAFFCRLAEPFSLAGNADTSFTVTFHPLADSIYAATLTIHSGERSLEIPLSGRGYTPSGIAEGELPPVEFSLKPAYPNPFNSSTSIRYSIPQAGQVRLSIFDLNGRLIQTLLDGERSAGAHTAVWDASAQPSGVYLARLETAGRTLNCKLTLVK